MTKLELNKGRKQIIYATIFFLFFISIFLGLFFHTRVLTKNWIKTEGIVIKIEDNSFPGDYTVLFHPVAEFKTQKGIKVVGHDRGIAQQGGLLDNKVGEEVNLYYNPENPQQIVIDNPFYIYYFPFSTIGILLLIYILWIYNFIKNNFKMYAYFGR